MLMMITIDNHLVSYHGFNGMWWASVNAWWLLWIANWWINDEDFGCELEATIDIYSTESKGIIYSESFSVDVRRALNDWSTKMDTLDVFGISLWTTKSYQKTHFEKVQKKFIAEIQKNFTMR